MYRYRIEYLKDEEVYPKLLKEHKEIIERINRGEKEEAATNDVRDTSIIR